MKKIPIPSKEDLYQSYSVEGGSISSIAKLYKTSNPVVRTWLNYYEIERRSHHEACLKSVEKKIKDIPTKEELESLYDSMNLKELQTYYSIGQATLYQWFAHRNVQLRSLSDSVRLGKSGFIQSLNINQDDMLQYIEMSSSLTEAIVQSGYSKTTFYKLLAHFDLEKPVFENFRSKTERFVFEYCKEIRPDLTWLSNDRSVINPYELDIVCPELRLAIEYCGIYWHSDWASGKDSKYHQHKLESCIRKGYNLITIFETDDLEKVLRHLKHKIDSKEKLYARKCEVREVSSKDATQFNNAYHMQGARGSSVHLGLYHENKLVQLLSMGKSRYNKKYEWECIRMTSSKLIIGGASKLFNHFINRYDPSSIITYADRRYGEGRVYLACDFEYISYTDPGYFYTGQPLSWKLESRQKYQKHKLKDLLEHYDDELTETQLMKLNGYDRIWDCGHNIYVWHK